MNVKVYFRTFSVLCTFGFLIESATSSDLRPIALACPSEDAVERGIAGPPGKRGATGLPGSKGEKGLKGDKGQSDNSRDTIQRLQDRIVELENDFTRKLEKLSIGRVLQNNSNCDDLYKQGIAIDGFYNMAVNEQVIEVYCEFQRDGHNWLLFQRRFSGDVDFYLNFVDYQKGFGQKSGEFWLGLDKLHTIASSGPYILRVDLEDWDGNTVFSEYSTFSIEDASGNYRLSIGAYSGTGGDALRHHNNRQFSAKDRDNDDYDGNCSTKYEGAWWYGHCHDSNLNGLYVQDDPRYDQGMVWQQWKGNQYSMKKSEMKIRPINN